MQVFISHSHETEALARKVGEALKRAGHGVWSDQEILPGDNWAEKIAQALEQSHAMVVLLTPHSLHSTSVRREIDYALSRKSFNKRLIPVLVGSEGEIAFENLPWILRHLNLIKLPAHGKEEEGINQITRALQAVA
ncbi:MAG: toll/interleukin-1 receptor domain-containing protein [Terriglobia bacterium]